MNAATETILKVRALLEDVTPLKSDCGRLCGALCCKDDESEEGESGMLLFPGEKELYAHQGAWMEIVDSALEFDGRSVPLLICRLPCPRRLRPLSCRIFPLFPYIGEDGAIHPAMDVRARPLCPLVEYGEQGLDPSFVSSVQKAGELLLQDETQKAFLQLLCAHLKEYLWL